MAPHEHELLALASDYLVKQGWFKTLNESDPGGTFELVTYESIRTETPGLARMLVEQGDQRFQLLVGWRPARDVTGVLRGEERALLGAVDDGDERFIVYDALADDELCKVILERATNGTEHAERVRPVASLVSHASLVFDERLFMKSYRVLESDTRAEVEIMFGLDAVGFNAMLAPVARWREDETDLALVREFLPSALEGRLLALTSLRDLLGQEAGDENGFHAPASAEDLDRMASSAGGDFAAEMTRLGEVTARLHLALAEAFGVRPLAREDFVTVAEDAGVTALLEQVEPSELGVAIRLHGDFHLRRVMRSESGWLIAGFGDDPLYAIEVRDPSLPPRTGSPLEDVADMSYALGQVAADAVTQRGQIGQDRTLELAAAWRRRNHRAFLRGYFRIEGIDALAGSDPSRRDLLLNAFEAIRERR